MAKSINRLLLEMKLIEEGLVFEDGPIKTAVNSGEGIAGAAGFAGWLTSRLPTKLLSKIASLGAGAAKLFGKIFSVLRAGSLGLEAKEQFDKGDYTQALILGLNAIGYIFPPTTMAAGIFDVIYTHRVEILKLIDAISAPTTTGDTPVVEVPVGNQPLSDAKRKSLLDLATKLEKYKDRSPKARETLKKIKQITG